MPTLEGPIYKYDVFVEEDAYLVEGITIEETTTLHGAIWQIIDNLINFQDLKHLKKATIGNCEQVHDINNSGNNRRDLVGSGYIYNTNGSSNNSNSSGGGGGGITINLVFRNKEDGGWYPLRMVHQLTVFDELKIITSVADFTSEGPINYAPGNEVDNVIIKLREVHRREVLSDED